MLSPAEIRELLKTASARGSLRSNEIAEAVREMQSGNPPPRQLKKFKKPDGNTRRKLRLARQAAMQMESA